MQQKNAVFMRLLAFRKRLVEANFREEENLIPLCASYNVQQALQAKLFELMYVASAGAYGMKIATRARSIIDEYMGENGKRPIAYTINGTPDIKIITGIWILGLAAIFYTLGKTCAPFGLLRSDVGRSYGTIIESGLDNGDQLAWKVNTNTQVFCNGKNEQGIFGKIRLHYKNA